jgi:hypothetical protein
VLRRWADRQVLTMRWHSGDQMQRVGLLLSIVTLISMGNLASHAAMGQEPSLVDKAPVARRAATPAADADALAREVQKELYRLGCFDEAVNGAWSSSSRAAAQKFLDRVNARLPVDKPDSALLALLQSSKGFVCTQCPSGELFDAAGRCVPKALVDKASRSPAIVTGTLQSTPSTPALPPNESTAEQREPAGAAQRPSRPDPEARYWRSMLRKVDRALGLY